MSYYSLLPGTNQLIEKNGKQGQALFNKHGYNLNRYPNHYDYYRALYDGDRRESFFDDLAGILGGVAKVWTSTTGGSRSSAVNLSSSTASNSIANVGSSSPFQIGSIPAKSDIGSFIGNSQSGVPRNAARNAAYLELVNHFRNEAIRRSYMDGFQQTNYYQRIPPVYSIGVQFANDGDQYNADQGGGGQSISNDPNTGGFGTDYRSLKTPLFILVAIVLGLYIWSKVR